MTLAGPPLELRPLLTRISEAEMELYYRLLRAAARAEAWAAGTVLPTRARDIAEDLKKELAFLSGGQGKDKSWIITFPENSNFNQVPKEILLKVLTYLTWIPWYNTFSGFLA